MNRTAKSNRAIRLALTTALTAGLLTGCATKSAPRADLSASKAQAALAKGKHQQAIDHAEAAVLADPRNAAYRAMLGSAYLDAGRFASAATTFDDAMKLGDTSARTALSLALSLAGVGDYQRAAAVLSDWEDDIGAADLGLAYALAGQPERGIDIMSNAIRGGDNTPKMRQNLAYSFALGGRWKEARLMAAQDVPADKLGERIEEWALMAQPQAWQARVAGLVGAPAGVTDNGQPVQLALGNHPSIEQLAAEAAAYAQPSELPEAAAVQAAGSELPVGDAMPDLAVRSYPAPQEVEPNDLAFVAAASAPLPQSSGDPVRFVNQPVTQAVPARQAAAAKAAPAVRTAAIVPKRSDGTHLVQLGSFASEQGARRSWGVYVKRYPQLASHRMVISQAKVQGKQYWRVSAAGFDRASSSALCGQVKSSGQGCIAYAESSPLPGAVDTGTRLARR